MNAASSPRLSLRRKRSTRSGENSGSPAVKKSSPKLPEAKKEPPCTPKTHTSRATKRPSHSARRTSPRLSGERSRNNSDNEDKSLKTPVSTKWTHENEESLRQPSPDMPFLSSQLCGTQDCEVVWDCDSPGFSKDDLKRMHGGGEADGLDKAMVIVPAPPRQLFPLSRSRPSKAASLGNTTAQLNELLDRLSSKGKEKNKNEDEGDQCHSLQQVVPPGDSYSEDSLSSEPMVLPRPLRDASSQPFEVTGVSSPHTPKYTASIDLDDSVWGEDLNIAMCDINDTRRSSEGVGVVKEQADKSRLSSEKAELSSASVDIFDDDLFSESVILSTQAVEEEALKTKNDKDITNNRCHSASDYSKGPQQKINNRNVEGEENGRNINSVKNTSKNSNKSELRTHSKLTTSGLNTNNINIDQKSTSDISLQRQVRRSFRFAASPTSAAKSDSSVVTRNTQHTLVAVPETQKYVKTNDTRCQTKKMNLLAAFNIEKPSAQNKNLVNRTTKTSSMPLNPQGTLPMLRKPLFQHDIKTEEVKNRSTTQGTRGPLVRSQSIGNTRLATSSPVARRSNSSMELDTSQDLEDDEFFKSILSMLPEDEECIAGDSGLPLSPITTEKFTGPHSSKNSLVNAGLSKVSQSIKSNNDRRLTNSASFQNNVSNGSVRSLVVGQVNMCLQAKKSKVDPSGRKPTAGVQGVRPNGTNCSSAKTKPLDTREPNTSSNKEQQSSDTFDDGLFEDDVLSLIDEVESQFGSQNAPSPSPSPQSQPQQVKCTQDEIARKKAAALQRREAKRRQQCR